MKTIIEFEKPSSFFLASAVLLHVGVDKWPQENFTKLVFTHNLAMSYNLIGKKIILCTSAPILPDNENLYLCFRHLGRMWQLWGWMKDYATVTPVSISSRTGYLKPSSSETSPFSLFLFLFYFLFLFISSFYFFFFFSVCFAFSSSFFFLFLFLKNSTINVRFGTRLRKNSSID